MKSNKILMKEGVNKSSLLIPVGKISSPWGIRGELKFFLYNPESKSLEKIHQVYLKSEDLFKPFLITSFRKQGKFNIIQFKGYFSPETSQSLKGKEVFIPLEELPKKEKGEIYWFELVGMTVYSSEEKKLGVVERIDHYGASEILVIKNEFSKEQPFEILIPFVSDFLKEISMTERKIVVYLIEGLV